MDPTARHACERSVQVAFIFAILARRPAETRCRRFASAAESAIVLRKPWRPGGEMADARDLKSLPRKGVRVRPPPRASLKKASKNKVLPFIYGPFLYTPTTRHCLKCLFLSSPAIPLAGAIYGTLMATPPPSTGTADSYTSRHMTNPTNPTHPRLGSSSVRHVAHLLPRYRENILTRQNPGLRRGPDNSGRAPGS